VQNVGYLDRVARRAHAIESAHNVGHRLEALRSLFDKVLVEELREREAVLRMHLQQLIDDGLGLGVDIVPHRVIVVELGLFNLLEHLGANGVAVHVERVIAGQQNKHEDAQRPDVDRVRVRLVVHELGRIVGPRAAHGAHRLVGLHDGGETKVDQLDLRVGRIVRQHDVLGLEIAVHNAARVQVLERGRHLPEVARCALLRVLALVDDAVEQVAARAVLHHEIDAAFVLVHVDERHNVGMPTGLLHNVDLLAQAANVELAAFGNQLDCVFLARRLVHAETNDAKVASARAYGNGREYDARKATKI
jgi:hypothetical protein